MKALVGTFNQEKALVGAFSVIVQPVVEPMDRFAALVVIYLLSPAGDPASSSSSVATRAQHCPVQSAMDSDTALCCSLVLLL